MIEKDPTSYSILTYAWVFGLAILGGVVSFMRKLQAGHAKVFNIVEFIGEIVTSAFAGVIAFWLCENAGFSPLATASIVGVCGHMGSRAIFVLEGWLTKQFPKL
jgi:hypothetical protein